MSWSGAVSLEPDPSDSRILIDACLARVREHAQLDAEPVLPPLDVLLGKPASPAPATRLVVSPSARQLPSAEAIVKAAAGRRRGEASARAADHVASPARRGARWSWPVVVCGCIGALFGGMAVMRSPIGQEPAVREVMTTAERHVEDSYAAAVAATTRLVNR
ncbi:MAG: hypothetical protein KF894_25840 [Labilithrix sp.]|nr:hypothetical protein [Labilithrix sp.]